RSLGGRLGGREHVDVAALAADLLEIAERLLLDGGEAARDVAFGGLRVGEVVGLVRLDDVVLIRLPHLVPLLADFLAGGALLGEVLAAGDLGGLAEHAVDALRDQLVVHVADGRARREAGRGVALAAFGRDPQVGDVALLFLELRGPLHVVLGDARGLRDRHDVAGAFDAEAGHRLAGLGDAVGDDLGPAILDADHHAGRDVRVRAGADDGAEERLEVLAELQAPVGVRDRERALDVVGDRLAGRVGEVVERQDEDVIAHADAAVLPAPARETQVRLAVTVGFRALSHGSPPLGLEIVDVDVLALLDVGDRLADVLAVLPHGVALLDVDQGNLMADRNIHLRSDLEGGIVGGDHGGHVGAGLEVLDHDD